MLRVKQRLNVKATKLNNDGVVEVLIKKDKVLIPHLLLNEEAEIEISKEIKGAYIADVVRVSKSSKDRNKVECPIYERCGSCHNLHESYEKQCKDKQKYVEELVKNARLSVTVDATFGMKEPYAYRNKMILGFARDSNRKLISGFYEEYSHRIIPFTRCLLHEEKSDLLFTTIHQLVERFRIEPYDEKRRQGILRHVVIRRAVVKDETMVVLVVNKKDVSIQHLAKEIVKKCPFVTTVLMNVNSRKTSIVLGDEEKVLYGPGFIVDELCGLNFKISAKSFYQINHHQTEFLYQKAIDLLNLKGNEVIMDTYSGIGTIGLIASKHVKQVISVELNKDAVKDAQMNAKMNRISNVSFYQDDATKFMISYASQKKKLDAIIMDPPRSGSTPEFIQAAVKCSPKAIVYVSCDPSTMVRDLVQFKRLGYITDMIHPYDMFPQTRHVECVCVLQKMGK